MTKTATMTAFYEATKLGDADALSALIDLSFHPDAVLSRPESLPGGGAVEGARTIADFLARAGRVPLAVDRISAAESGCEFFAAVTVSLAGTSVKALERWTFVEDRVTAIDAFYWDTAAMLRHR